jgi:ferredoxin
MAATKYKVTIIFENKETTFDCPSDKYILEAAADNGISLPYSCGAGTCSTCVGIVKSGSVDQADQSSLDEEQLAKGYVLTCVAYPASDVTILADQQANMF